MSRLPLEHGIKLASGFLVLGPSSLTADRADLQPDVIQIELPEQKARLVVCRLLFQARPCLRLASRKRGLERRQLVLGRRAVLGASTPDRGPWIVPCPF